MIRGLAAGLIVLVSFGGVAAAGEPPGRGRRDGPPAFAAEERLVRSAYAAMSRYNKARYVADLFADSEWLADDVAMTFELRDVHTGPIEEILSRQWGDLVTAPSGDIIRGTTQTTTIGDAAYFSYDAQWEAAPWSPLNSMAFTVSEAIALEHEKLNDVGKYTSYEVTVRFEGRSRTYRAMAVYKNRFAAENDYRPEFLDNIVGLTGEVTRAAREKKPALIAHRTEPAPSATSTDRFRVTSSQTVSEIFPFFDQQYHNDGGHGATFYITKGCSEIGSASHECRITATSSGVVESGSRQSPWYGHYGARDQVNDVQGGPRSTEVKCGGGIGVAVTRCLLACNITVEVKADGKGYGAVSATINTSGELPFYKDKLGIGWTCAALPDVPGGDDRDSVGDPVVCDSSALPLYDGGIFVGCFSPILIDMEGDGFALTNAAGGVDFDIAPGGAVEHISWTAAGSDEAFLVLDRNGNGAIDDGAELFGNFTPQPPSANRNGFAALAEYDRTDGGGNGDGEIDEDDAIFASLRLWTDSDHDGRSTPDELATLHDAGVTAVELRYHESRRVDEHGNWFRYRAKVEGRKGSGIARWAWDVFFTTTR